MEVGEIHFPNGNRAGWVRASPEEEAAPLLRALGLERPRALLLLLGGADAMAPESEARLRQWVSRGLAMAAVESGALVMDGGTHTGIMALMGQGMAGLARRASLLGVVPEGRIIWPGRPAGDGAQAQLDPNHSHFVLVDSDVWGGETGMLFRLAAGLAQGAPVAVVLINGGRIAQDELLLAVRQRWPIIIVQGSGRLADELAGLLQQPRPLVTDPVLAEILADGDLCLFPREGRPASFKRRVLRHLQKASYLTYPQAEGPLLQFHQVVTARRTERVLQNKLTGWLQEMRDALARLHARKDTPSQEVPSKAPHPIH
jgi:hypothetical protein